MTNTNGIQSNLERFSQGLKDTLDDILTLEVNTMIVNEIRGFKFNPFTAYEEIYSIPANETEFKNIIFNLSNDPNKTNYESTYKKYDENRETVESDTLNELKPELSYLHAHIKGSKLSEYLKKVFIRKMSFEDLESPENIEKTMKQYLDLRKKLKTTYLQISKKGKEQELLEPNVFLNDEIFQNSVFLRELRRIRELMSLVGGIDSTKSNICDLIYAQTVIELDGDTMNRFHKNLLEDKENKDFLLTTHQKALEQGQKNWRGLISIIVETMKQIADLVN